MATCYRHPSRETAVSCSSCGRPICPSCMTPTPVGMRCPECSKDRTKVRTVDSVGSDATRVTTALIAINAIAFLGEIASNGTANGLYYRGGLFGPSVADGEVYRLLTSGFLHALPPFGFLHIGLNMYLLYVLGQMLERSLGSVRFAGIYLVSLLTGS